MKAYIGRYPKDSSKERKINIRIDNYDSWNADVTIALIAAPLLTRLKETKQGAPYVEDKDVPEGLNLRSTEAPPKENEWDIDANHFKRWDWVLDEIIWAMNELANEKPTEDSFYDWSEVDESEPLHEQLKKIKG